MGTLDAYDPAKVVDITPYRTEVAPAVIPWTSLFLQASLLDPPQRQAQGLAAPYVCQLPILGDLSAQPWLFATCDASKARLVFQLFSSLESKSHGPIGTCIALLASLRGVLGSGRESLIGLVCWSHGDLNDDSDSALVRHFSHEVQTSQMCLFNKSQIQAEAGVDVIIANQVRLIANALRERRKLLEARIS